MRPGSYLINNSRGTVVDLEALAAGACAAAICGRRRRRLPGRAGFQCRALRLAAAGPANVILTPHVGGSTEEAQERIGAEVARKLSIIPISARPWAR
jgi:D-3-phosphoglycerate dehydrogenase